MNTSTPRFWVIGGALMALLMAALGWTFLISPRMDAVAQTREQAVQLDDQATMITSQAHQLQIQAQTLPEQIAALTRIQRKIPESVDVPTLLRDIQSAARANDVTIDSLSPGTITVFIVEESDPPAKSAQDSNSSDEAQASPDPTQRAKPTPTPTDLGQGRLPQGVGLSYVPITITATGEFRDLQRFTARVESLQRAFLITGVQLARGQNAQSEAKNPLQLTLDARVFVANDRLRDLPDQALQQVEDQ